MQQKAAQELVKRERQQSLLIAMGRIAPTEGDLALLERDQALVLTCPHKLHHFLSYDLGRFRRAQGRSPVAR